MSRQAEPCTLAGQSYAVDLAGYQRAPVAAMRDAQDQSAEPGEQTLMPTAQWKRTMSDWVEAAGQVYFDDPFEGNRRRFNTSFGMHPWDRRELKLHQRMSQLDFDIGLGVPSPGANLMSVGDRIYTTKEDELQYYDNVVPGTGWANTTVVITGGALGTLTAATTNGTKVWFTDGNDIRQNLVTSGVSTSFSSTNVDMLIYAGGRLFGAAGPILYQFPSSGLPSIVYTHTNSDWSWTGVVAAPGAIYCFGADDVESAIYGIDISSETGDLAVPVIAASMPRRELATALAFYAGFAIIGTTRGIRVANINSDNSLAYGPRIDVPVVADVGINHLAADAEFVYFPWMEDDVALGVGRLNLARFTDELVPAYATDVMYAGATTSNPSRATAPTMDALIFHGDRLVLGVATTNVDDGVWYVDNDTVLYENSGELYSGRIGFGLFDSKRYDGVDVKLQPLPAVGTTTQSEVNVYTVEDDGTETLILTIDTPGATSGRAAITGLAEEWLELKVEIVADDDVDETPVVERVTLIATPTPFRVEELFVPILTSTEIRDQAAGNSAWGQDPFAIHTALAALMQSRETIDFTMGSETLSVYVDGVVMKGDDPTAPLWKWSDDGTWVEGIVMVKLVTVEALA